MSASGMMLFSGNANPELVTEIAGWLNLRQGKAIVGRFSDGEMMAEIQESVRGRDVYVIQSTSQPTNDNLMELLVLMDALRWASAERVTAVIPYFGYARQDRRLRSARVPKYLCTSWRVTPARSSPCPMTMTAMIEMTAALEKPRNASAGSISPSHGRASSTSKAVTSVRSASVTNSTIVTKRTPSTSATSGVIAGGPF